MAKHKSEFVQTVMERGFIQDCSDIEALDDLASREIITAYIGFDCTAPTLHAGSLLQIMLLRWFQKTGNKPIVLIVSYRRLPQNPRNLPRFQEALYSLG